MYHVSAQGVDERMINVHYYYYYYSQCLCLYGVTVYGSGCRKVVVNQVTGVCPNWPNQIYLYLSEDSTG